MRNDASNALYWQADAADAQGQLTQITHGNFVSTTQTYDANTGRIATIAAGISNSVQNMSFVFDTIGNLASRTDVISNLVESFTYDDLNRLTGATIVQGVNTPVTKTFSYNATGNIVTKSDHGVYSYPAQGAASVRPNAVSSVVTASGTKVYAYDANGNMTSGDGRTMTWTPFNMPLTIAQGASTLAFAYDTERQRVKQTAPDGTTHYINDTSAGLKSEKFIGASSTRWVNYVYAGGGIAAVVNVDSVSGTTTRYFHKDHLGSTAVITDESGNVVERLAYDAWGKRRNTNGADDPTNSLTSLTTRGFTGHEHLQAVALVHMNGRVYDPLLGRFLSADPFIQDPLNTQSLNRYSYVLNNPLCYTDPSGFFFKSIMRFFQKNPIAAMIVGVALAWATGGISLTLTGIKVSFWGAVTAGATSGLLTGGIKGAIIGGISGALTSGIGGLEFGLGETFDLLGKAALHGVAQGGLAEVQGGSFGAAFLSASFSKVAMAGVADVLADTDFDNVATNMVASAVIGGTASVIAGGNFQNGASTAAFIYLFNELASRTVERMYNGQRGHHIVPKQLALKYKDSMDDDAIDHFSKQAIGHFTRQDMQDPDNPHRGFTKEHKAYNRAVEGKLQNALSVGRMTQDRAIAFTNEIRNSLMPEIRNFSDSIIRYMQTKAQTRGSGKIVSRSGNGDN